MSATAITNVAEAQALLTHKRTGRMMGSRRVAHNTKLVYVTDSMAALVFHSTPIVWYGRGRLAIDVRGWHTRTTWRRVAEFTPVDHFTKYRLHFVAAANGEVLYDPPLRIDSKGNVLNPMLPSRQHAITRSAATGINLLRNAARKAVERWDDLSTPYTRCQTCEREDNLTGEGGAMFSEMANHFIDHFNRGEWVLPREWSEGGTAIQRHPDAVVEQLRRDYSKWLMRAILPVIVERGDPNGAFKFHHHPMHEPQRRIY